MAEKVHLALREASTFAWRAHTLTGQTTAQRKAATKAERKARAGLSRAIKLRLYPTDDQANQVNRTIGTIRFCWNTLWLPMLEDAVRKRAEHAKANGETKEAWKEAWRLYPDPTETHYNRARIAAAKNEATKWIAEALNTPLTRATRNFALAVQASRGKTQSGGKRSGKAGRVQPRSRRDDSRAGLEWQLQGKATLGGVNESVGFAHPCEKTMESHRSANRPSLLVRACGW